MAKCRSCGAQVEWALTTANKRIPLDPGYSESGDLELLGFDGEHKIVRKIISGDDIPVLDRRRSHWDSCPDAEDWRRRHEHRAVV